MGDKIGLADGASAIRRLAPELINADAAQRAALSANDITAAVNAVYGISEIMRFTSLGTATTISAIATACRVAKDAKGEAGCMRCLADIALARSDHETARKAYEQALLLFRHAGSIRGAADCIHRLGVIAFERSDYEAAHKAYDEALPLYRQIGAILGEANCIKILGNIALVRSDHEGARKAYEQALLLYRQVGNVLGEANCIQSLGRLSYALEDHDAARVAYDQALSLFEHIAEPYSIGRVHDDLASVTEGATQAGHRAAAKRAWLSIGRDDLVKKYGLSDA